PEVFKQTHKFISLKEFVFAQFFGKYIVDYSIASATGLFDIKQKVWCDEALAAAGITADFLSTPVEVTQKEDDLLPKYKHLSPTDRTLAFIIGGNDGCLANLGSGVIEHGDASLTIGTSGAIRMTSHQFRVDEQQRTFTYLLTNDIYINGGAINNGGITLEWLSKNVVSEDINELLELAQTAKPGANRLLFLPYLLGERAPMWDAAAKGVLFGLTQQHTKADIARATMEGICFAMRDVLGAIEEVNGPITSIYASGGFTKSQFWLQTMSDVLNKEIMMNNSADASATGAAIIGLYALGYLKSLEESKKLFSVQRTYSPNASTSEIYNSLFFIFQSLYPKLKDEFVAIGKL
ncbi:MAG: FGGY-family carbohydrate kinase, partial [Bacteroidota bacterium]|nr:FGGY-family carbohydrate kinase [Bacteroidota bacterium]